MKWEKIYKSLTGFTSKRDFRYRDLLRFTFKKRSDINNTYNFSDLNLPQPWIFSRVFLILAILIILNLFSVEYLGVIPFPYLTLLVAAIIPLTIITFLFEINTVNKVALRDLVFIFLFGSALSFISLSQTSLRFNNLVVDSILISLTEELAKIIPIFLALIFLKTKKIGSAFLIGFTIGLGLKLLRQWDTQRYTAYRIITKRE